MGSQTLLEKNPGCGETPGPTGIPASIAGGCPCMLLVLPVSREKIGMRKLISPKKDLKYNHSENTWESDEPVNWIKFHRT